MLLPLKIKLCLLLAVPVVGVPLHNIVQHDQVLRQGKVCEKVDERVWLCYDPKALAHAEHVAHGEHVLHLEHLAA